MQSRLSVVFLQHSTVDLLKKASVKNIVYYQYISVERSLSVSVIHKAY